MSIVVRIVSVRDNPHTGAYRTCAPGITHFECGVNGEISMHRDVIDVTAMPGPQYLVEYDSTTPVVCDTCGATFTECDLKSDECVGWDGDERWSNHVCPECGEWDCCDIEYETIEQYRERGGK
ncbi:MAG: hypothetical protein IMZ50_16500 [Candidatus Atribacteria bacterium]|nr:hypothetical protein [Candidatus Atribacteria bacterium]